MAKENGNGERWTDAYNRMLERIRHRIEELEHDTKPRLEHAVEKAQETASELGELTREEAEKISLYLRRDLQDAAEFVADSGRELSDWLRFDWQLVEQGMADLFTRVVDQTRVELGQLQQRAEAFGEWHTGEVAGIGTLECKSCGEHVTFTRTGRIPPCPRCHGTTFRRPRGE